MILAALILFGETTGAHAELRATPLFDAGESRVISRNDLLRKIVDVDPWLVRHILDVIAKNEASARRGEKSDAPEGIDASKNPDLAGMPKNALSSKEWLDLVKQAKAEKDKREQDDPHSFTRDYRGTVDILEMMKQAKEKKSDSAAK